MRNPASLLDPSEIWQQLNDCRALITQRELRLFTELRDALWYRSPAANWALFEDLRENLFARFESGSCLIEMGAISMYRDHTGAVVIGDTGELALRTN